MKRTLAVLLCAVLCIGVCSGSEEEKEPARTYELAMITVSEDKSIDDGDYVQSAWEGLKEYAEESGLTYKYYEPAKDSDSARMKQIDRAADSGALIVVCAGGAFQQVVAEAQEKYPDVTFILSGAVPKDGSGEQKTASNCVGIEFNWSEAGFLAGYAAVQEGYRQLGFLGESSEDEMKDYGYGFLQGCNAAAESLGVYVEVRYNYGSEDESAAKIQKKAEQWYKEGTEVIFACGDTVFDSVAVEADIADALVIASDPQSRSARSVLTTVVKEYGRGGGEQLAAFYSGEFPGGTILETGVAEEAVGLDMDSAQFTYFQPDDYREICDRLKEGEIKPASAQGAKTAVELTEKLQLRNVNLIV